MTKLKFLFGVLIALVVFCLGTTPLHGEQEELLPKVEVSTGDTTEETIIYTWEMTKQSLTEKVDNLVGNYSISSATVEECTTQVPDNYKKCIEDVIGISNAESTIFKKGMSPSQNGFGLMYKGRKRRFSSVEEGIKTRVSLYVKNNWESRTTGAAWLRGKYCTSACTHWVHNYSSAIKKLSLDD